MTEPVRDTSPDSPARAPHESTALAARRVDLHDEPQDALHDDAQSNQSEKPSVRKALVIGIDAYRQLRPLHGCVNDAQNVSRVLESNEDGSANFNVRLMTASDGGASISRGALKDAVRALFSDDPDIAVLYFAGHGHVESTGGYLCSTECERGDDGLALDEVLTLAIKSRAREKIIILDACHSGAAGNPAGGSNAELPDGMTILTAATQEQYADEENGSGVFTALLVDALEGAAANLVGEVTPGSMYAHIDQSLGPWKQRPVFKTNVKRFVSLRRVNSPISVAELQLLKTFFPTRGYEFPLDPTFEPELRNRGEGVPAPIAANTEHFAILQRYNRVNLLKPVGAPHMWHAAMESKSCKLTALGEHYRRLVVEKLI